MLRSGSVFDFLYSIQTSLMSRFTGALGAALGTVCEGLGIYGYSQSVGLRSARTSRGRLRKDACGKNRTRLLLIGRCRPDFIGEIIFSQPAPKRPEYPRRRRPARPSTRRTWPLRRRRSHPAFFAPSPPPPVPPRTSLPSPAGRCLAPSRSSCRRSCRRPGTRRTPAAPGYRQRDAPSANYPLPTLAPEPAAHAIEESIAARAARRPHHPLLQPHRQLRDAVARG